MSIPEEILHTAICQAVNILNLAPELAAHESGRDVRAILRKALVDYADAFMDQPVTESERGIVAAKHRKSVRQRNKT